MKIRPKVVDDERRGRILQVLLLGVSTTSDIVDELSDPYVAVRDDLIHLYHLGVIQLVGEKRIIGQSRPSLMDKDAVWALSEHGLSHYEHFDDCRACRSRKRLLLRMRPDQL